MINLSKGLFLKKKKASDKNEKAVFQRVQWLFSLVYRPVLSLVVARFQTIPRANAV